MDCGNCGTKLKCRNSIPVGPEIRSRLYKCPMCGGMLTTVEMPELALKGGRWTTEEVVAAVDAARRRQWKIVKAVMAKKGRKG